MAYSKEALLDTILKEIANELRFLDSEISRGSMHHNVSATDQRLDALLNVLEKSDFFPADRNKVIAALREMKSKFSSPEIAEKVLPEKVFDEINKNPLVDFLKAGGDILSEEGKEILRSIPDWMITEVGRISGEMFSETSKAMFHFEKNSAERDIYSKIINSDRWGHLFPPLS